MATGFDYLAQAGVQNAERQSQLRDEARIAQRDATAGLLMNSLNNPDLKPEDRATLIQQHNALYQPHEAPTLISRLSGLIHGQTSAAATTPTQSAPGAQSAQTGDPSFTPPAGPVNELGAQITPPPPTQQTNELGAPLPPNQPATDETAHPFATTPHPLAQKAHDLIAGLQNHLSGFANPTAPTTTPAESTASLIARTYASPEELKRKDADLAGTRALNLEAERRKRFLLTATPENKFLNQYAVEHGAEAFNELPVTLQSEGIAAYKKANVGPRLTTAIVVDPDSSTGFSKVNFNQVTGETTSTIPGITPPRGFIPTQRVNRSVDQYGNVTSSVNTTTPQLPGARGVPAVGKNGAPISSKAPQVPTTLSSPVDATPASPASLDALQARVNGNRTTAPAAKAPVSSKAPQVPVNQPRALDADGQIPAGAANPQVREYAQQLLDDRDVDKIPAKARADAASLARQYGWEQGKFTPREQGQLRTAVTFLDQFRNSDALNVLNSPIQRYNIATVLDPHAGNARHIAASELLTPEAKEFIRNYNIAAGTVQGLSGLTRSGRPVEAGVKRLMTELPSVLQSSDAADAKARIDNLLKEVDVSRETTLQNKTRTNNGKPVSKNAPKVPSSGNGQTLADRLNEALGK